MSYLNSILSSIKGGNTQPASPSTRDPPRTESPRQAQNGVSANSGGVVGGSLPPKRKAEGDPGTVVKKIARKDTATTVAARPMVIATGAKPSAKPATPPVGYQGTARPNSAGPLSSKNKSSASQPPLSAPLAASSSSLSTSAAAASSAPPKKGTFAEILARGKMNQQSVQPTIGIKHKPTEKMSRKERLLKAQEEAKKKKRPEGKDTRPSQARRSRSPEKAKGASGVTQKPKRVTTDLGYKGTMRPSAAAPAYTGTMRPSGAASKPAVAPPAKAKAKVRMAGYASYSEHSDDDMHSDDWDEDLSDMEAGISDVEEEEMSSLRAARKEDDEALREENELKRKKFERKNLVSRR